MISHFHLYKHGNSLHSHLLSYLIRIIHNISLKITFEAYPQPYSKERKLGSEATRNLRADQSIAYASHPRSARSEVQKPAPEGGRKAPTRSQNNNRPLSGLARSIITTSVLARSLITISGLARSAIHVKLFKIIRSKDCHGSNESRNDVCDNTTKFRRAIRVNKKYAHKHKNRP